MDNRGGVLDEKPVNVKRLKDCFITILEELDQFV